VPASTPAPVVEVSDMMDPLSHLYHIFEKIKKQVIEWGEDANWKIDVFLLPNEEGPPSSSMPGQHSSGGGPHPISRMDSMDGRRPVQSMQDIEMGHGRRHRNPNIRLRLLYHALSILTLISMSSWHSYKIASIHASATTQ
jgi:hypothetical protein